MKGRAGLGGCRENSRLDVAILFAIKAAIGALLLARGFTHVSDDDYARTVIAEAFAASPRLDPSGTSWLPLPFWIHGAAMMLGGRSLATARATACALGVVATAAPYLALRAVGVARGRALAGVLLAMSTPWSAWTGVATVPEEPTAALVAAAAIAASRVELAPWAAACALAASLSRYEAWPVCALVALAAIARAPRSRAAWVAAVVAAAGPVAWIAWNAHAHGDPLHFVARVAAFRRATESVALPLGDKLLTYPAALVRAAPELALLGAVALPALARRDMRARWALPLACAASVALFLVYGDMRDGAPTHHPERPLLGALWIVAMFGADAVAELASLARARAGSWFVRGASAAVVAACVARSAAAWGDYPGRGEEDRRAQIGRGLALRERGATHARVVPCAYEHFALIAAFGAPERIEIAPGARAPVTALCPRVEER